MFILANTCTDFIGVAIPNEIPYIVHTVINIIKIIVPIMLIIFGMLDLGKAVAAGKEDDIKKGQQTFMKRAIAAVIVFLIVAIVQIVIGLVGKANTANANVWTCVDCFINNTCSVPDAE